MKNKLLLLLLSASILASCQNNNADKKEEVKSQEKSQETSEQKQPTTDIAYKEGEYKAVAQGVDGDVEVIVKLGKDKIESVEIGEENETSGICEAVYETIPKAIVDKMCIRDRLYPLTIIVLSFGTSVSIPSGSGIVIWWE